MTEIRTAVTIAAPPATVWADLSDIASHVEWMADAVEIRFTSESTGGTGTTFECDTRVGPFRLTDLMEITEWQHHRRMGVRHVGLVTGTGVFTLEPRGETATVFTWTERLRFPWWLGGPLAAVASRPVTGWIWRRNLTRLKARIEGATGGGDHPVRDDQPNT